MKYLFWVIPIPKRAWVKLVIGLTWIFEAQLETYLAFKYLPRYLIELVGPLDYVLIGSTLFAVTIGATHLGLALVQFRDWYSKKFQSYGW
jgi:hypothetical protein